MVRPRRVPRTQVLPHEPRRPGPPVAPGFSDAGAATVLELQKPRLPPIHTPFSVAVLPTTICPSASRGAGWLTGRLDRLGACASRESLPPARTSGINHAR
jgi:hypothetical protein